MAFSVKKETEVKSHLFLYHFIQYRGFWSDFTILNKKVTLSMMQKHYKAALK